MEAYELPAPTTEERKRACVCTYTHIPRIGQPVIYLRNHQHATPQLTLDSLSISSTRFWLPRLASVSTSNLSFQNEVSIPYLQSSPTPFQTQHIHDLEEVRGLGDDGLAAQEDVRHHLARGTHHAARRMLEPDAARRTQATLCVFLVG
jgi:hypothetical protein